MLPDENLPQSYKNELMALALLEIHQEVKDLTDQKKLTNTKKEKAND